jgi:hypothetical protein
MPTFQAFLVLASLAVKLFSPNQQARFQAPRVSTGCFHFSLDFDSFLESASALSQPAQLPRFPRSPDREKLRPKLSMNKRVFPVDQLNDDEIGLAGQFFQGAKDVACCRMSPPRSMNRLAGNDRSDARPSRVSF